MFKTDLDDWRRVVLMTVLGIVWVLLMPVVGRIEMGAYEGDLPNSFLRMMVEPFALPAISISIPFAIISGLLCADRAFATLGLFLIPFVSILAAYIAFGLSDSGIYLALIIGGSTAAIFIPVFLVTQRLTFRWRETARLLLS